ncbi:hypothetical protein [Cochleicola gelatinilyticus]|uniref:Diacylglycerol glucosyltransferase N-terminal domain-containing protein n=1 Tax=Cochleicola gelatinilyticus TaxID=1763537 RepID=A0A167EP43_9FLAO|nr:hypothetical protein [Cochleicola gelatinilyticus]OAB75735.1 hypothetical protein ULVI_14770 [Cochleicola gelatinilyticus]
MKKKLLFVVPDGVGIKNYLYSDLLTHLKEDADITFWSALPEAAFSEVGALHDISIKTKQLVLAKEPLRTRLYREAATYARLLHNSKHRENPTIMSSWRKKNKKGKLKILYTVAEFLGRWASKRYARILKFEQKSRENWSSEIISSYQQQLKELAPDNIFITHQRVASLMPICLAARKEGIPVISAIYSWDNLPKARLAVQPDTYLVWSSYMKTEMEQYYPEIDQETVLVTGTPQFEFYFKEDLFLDRDSFAKQNGLDAHKKWVCYSGDDVLTSPNDPEYLEHMAEAVLRIPEERRPQLLFRRAPVDASDRFNAVLKKFETLIIPLDPIWEASMKNWGWFFPKTDDLTMLVNLARHSEFVVNIGSTMAHDFAVYNKPCFYIFYDSPKNPDWSVDTVYKFQHFRTMTHLDAVGWIKNKNEWDKALQQGLESPKVIGKDKKEWMKVIVEHPLTESSKQIATYLLSENTVCND